MLQVNRSSHSINDALLHKVVPRISFEEMVVGLDTRPGGVNYKSYILARNL